MHETKDLARTSPSMYMILRLLAILRDALPTFFLALVSLLHGCKTLLTLALAVKAFMRQSASM